MASYHLCVKILSRSSGRSGVAAAAYRSRSQIEDKRQGMTFDYSAKKDLGHSEILAPENAPEWVYDRAKLWNAVEAGETRKDSQIMRDIEGALPVELNLEQQINLVREYCKENFVKKGMIADFNIHSDDHNPHVHIMLTMRDVDENGFGEKNRSWNKRNLVDKWREEWANVQNVHLAKAGFDVRVDHRSYAEQGIDIEPQIKLGITGIDINNSDYERANEYKRVSFENGQRIIANPGIALEHISKYQSTFTYEDILKYVHSHCDDSQFYDAVNEIRNSDELIIIEKNDYDRFTRYTTKGLLRTENEMFNSAKDMALKTSHVVDEKYIKQALKNNNLSAEQRKVFENVVGGNDINIIVGNAGTGKSYTLRAINEAYSSAGYNLKGVALAGIAAEGLETSSGIKSESLAKTFKDWEGGRNKLNKKSILVVDEAGMLGTRQMNKLLDEAKEAGAKIIMVGDTAQTQAIEAGGAFRGIQKIVGSSRLQQVWRQNDEWQREATQLFSGNTQDIHSALDIYRDMGRINEYETYDQAAKSMVDDYVRGYHPAKTSIITAHKNEDIARLNLLSRELLRERTNYIDEKEVEIETSTGLKRFSVGDRVLFLQNNRGMNVKNGTLGTIETIDKDGGMTIAVSGKRSVSIDTNFYNYITYGYAATTHKLQGATVDKAYFLASEGADRHLTYVAMSRHESQVKLYYSKDKFQNYEDLKRKVSSLGEKELLVDFKKEKNQIEKLADKLTRMNATFKEKDLNDIGGDLSEEQLEQLNGLIKTIDSNDEGQIYTTHKMAALEKKLFENASRLSERKSHAIDQGDIDKRLSQTNIETNQHNVINRVLKGSDLTLIDYQYDTDRAHLAGKLGQIFRDKGYVVEGITLSNMGAENFEKDSKIETTTAYKRLWEIENHRNPLSPKTVIMIDNANMIGTEQTQNLLEAAENAGARVIMFGDQQHLQSVCAGGAYRGIYENTKAEHITLKRVNYTHSWRNEANDLIAGDDIDAKKAIDLYMENGAVIASPRAREIMAEEWIEDVRASGTYKGRIMMAYKKSDVTEINDIARKKLKEIGRISSGEKEVMTDRKGAFLVSQGERVIFKRNDKELNIKGGEIGTLTDYEGHTLSFKMDDGRKISVNTRLYNDFDYGYATTLYTGTSSNHEKAYVFATKHMTKHATQAAFQSGSKDTRLYHSFNGQKELKGYLARSSFKDLASDYPQLDSVYKIKVNVDGFRQPFEKTIIQKAELSSVIAKRKITRVAKAYAASVCTNNRVDDPDNKITVAITQLDHEKAQEYYKNREKTLGKGRGVS